MAVPRKGSRRIKVDGVLYRWRVRHKPTYGQALVEYNGGMIFSVELEAGGGSALIVQTRRPRVDNWVGEATVSVRPFEVAQAIRSARIDGWLPNVPGKPYEMKFSLPVVDVPDK